ncbi:MAG: hypothetical protein HQK54_07640 [Oligoflexales bacterium]|nr:hypothetical protein [Oligoflexales bacterium]
MDKIWLLLISLLLNSCGFGVITDPLLIYTSGVIEKKSKIGVSVASLDSSAARLRESESMALLESPFLNPKCTSCGFTFTPTSLKLFIENVSICPDSNGLACQANGDLKGFSIDIKEAFEFIGRDPSMSLGTFSQPVREKDFGIYQAAGAGYPGKVHTVSGKITVGSQTYIIDNVKSYSSASSGGTIKMASS